jgi:hypothetical protein
MDRSSQFVKLIRSVCSACVDNLFIAAMAAQERVS